MNIHNVQRTGKMYYVYLPTSWCKKQHISEKTKIALIINSDNTITLTPTITERKQKQLQLTVNEDDENILHKLIVACYLNPASSFKITLMKPLSIEKLLRQKKQISIELVESSTNAIVCDSSLTIDDVHALLQTMSKKVNNLLMIMSKNYHDELIQRYEEEIDRTRMLIEKYVIDALTFARETKLKSIDLYYIALLAKDLERFVDTIIKLKKTEKAYFRELLDITSFLREIIENQKTAMEYKTVIQLIKKIEAMKDVKVKDVATYDKKRSKQILSTIAETLIDWAITKELE